MQNNNQRDRDRKEKETENQYEQESQKQQSPQNNQDTKLEKLRILRIKNDPAFRKLINNIKKSPDKQKELKDKYIGLFGENFGDLEMSPQDKKDLFSLELEINRRYKNEFKKVDHRLLNSPPEKNFEGFPKSHEAASEQDNSCPNLESVRLALAVMPPEIQAIFNEYFTLKFVSNDWASPDTTEGRKNNSILSEAHGGCIVKKIVDPSSHKDKFCIYIDKESVYENRKIKIGKVDVDAYVFNPEKITYLVAKAIVSTIADKSEFEHYCKKEKISKKIDKNNDRGWDDWLAFCFSDPKLAKKADDALYNKAMSWLRTSYNKKDFINFQKTPNQFIVKSRMIDEHLLDKRLSKWIDADTKEEIKGVWGWIMRGLGSINEDFAKGFYTFATSIRFNYEYDYYYTYLADLDGKEVNRLLSRDLGTGDYVKMIKEPRFLKDKDRLRQLILVIANKGAYQWWMSQLWLWKYDSKFRWTKGKEVSADGFDFISRVSKAASKGYKLPMATEYVKKGNKYVRFSYQSQVGKLDAILNTFSLRQLQGLNPDVYNNANNDGNFVDIDANLGDGTFLEGKDKENDSYVTSLNGKLSSIIGGGQAKKFISEMQNYARDLNEEEFNRLVSPLTRSATRRFLQASREESALFSMYTSPLIRNGFSAYKNSVGEPSYSEKQLDSDFDPQKKDFEKYNFDINTIVKKSSLEDLTNIYNDFIKEKRKFDYTAGVATTKYGKLLEFIRHSKNKIQDLNLPTDTQEYIDSLLRKITSPQTIITNEELNRIHSRIDRETSTNPAIGRDQAVKLQKNMTELLKYLENLGIVNQYHKVFEPYRAHFISYMGKSSEKNDIKERKKDFQEWFYKELLPASDVSTEDKLKNIRLMLPELKLSYKDYEDIYNQPNPQQEMAVLSNKVIGALKNLGIGGKARFRSDYEDLSQLLFESNDISKNGKVDNDILTNLSERVKMNGLIPAKIKYQGFNDLDDIIMALNLSKVIADDYDLQERSRQQSRNGQEMLNNQGYNQEIEDEMEEMEQE